MQALVNMQAVGTELWQSHVLAATARDAHWSCRSPLSSEAPRSADARQSRLFRCSRHAIWHPLLYRNAMMH